jgi:hypothetical protein
MRMGFLQRQQDAGMLGLLRNLQGPAGQRRRGGFDVNLPHGNAQLRPVAHNH